MKDVCAFSKYLLCLILPSYSIFGISSIFWMKKVIFNILAHSLKYLFYIYRLLVIMISCPPCNWNTLWNILMVLVRNVEQDEATSRTRMTTQPFLLLVLSLFVIFDNVYALFHVRSVSRISFRIFL